QDFTQRIVDGELEAIELLLSSPKQHPRLITRGLLCRYVRSSNHAAVARLLQTAVEIYTTRESERTRLLGCAIEESDRRIVEQLLVEADSRFYID
ncbi:MAG TPA: hypothetical protein PLV25_05000, partial [Opitutales bacterium]|nr:hypothetical protein [Opitutales bacterium]